ETASADRASAPCIEHGSDVWQSVIYPRFNSLVRLPDYFEPLAEQLRGSEHVYQRDIEEVKGVASAAHVAVFEKRRRAHVLDRNRLANELRARGCRSAIAEHWQGIGRKLHANIGDRSPEGGSE